jgi:hypothetical protein
MKSKQFGGVKILGIQIAIRSGAKLDTKSGVKQSREPSIGLTKVLR